MLKKRILASSMASVMALSSVSVVAFADETASSINTEAVSKAQLKEYVKSFDKFVEDELEDYGTIQEGWFTDAIDAANVVIDNRDATDEDVTVAYQMLKAVENKLQMYTSAEIKELLDECKSDYETENEYNAAFHDEIWSEDSWDVFEEAYERAEAYADEEGSAELNDAYLELEMAHNALDANDSVSKSEFRKVYQEYIELKDKVYDYESWRRGTCSVNATTGGYKDTKGGKLNLTNASYVTFGELYNIVFGSSDDALWEASTTGDARGVAAPSAATAGKTWIYHDGSGVEDFIDAEYDHFLQNAEKNITTNEDIYKAYKSAVEAVKVFNGWEEVKVKGSSKVILDDLLEKYRSNLLGDKDSGNGIAAAIVATVNGTHANALEVDPNNASKVLVKTVAAANEIKIDKDTKKIALDTDNKTYDSASDNADKLSSKGTFKVGDDVTKYIPVTAELIKAMANDTAGDIGGDATAAETAKNEAQAILDEIDADELEAAENAITALEAGVTAVADYGTAVGLVTTYVGSFETAVGGATNLDAKYYALTAGTPATDTAYKTKKAAYDAVKTRAATGSIQVDADDVAAAADILAKAKAYINQITAIATQAEADYAADEATATYGAAWYNDLEDAMDMYIAAVAEDTKKKNDVDYDYSGVVAAIDENDTVSEKDKGTKAYALLIKYTTFALDNVYPKASSPKTLKDITAVANKAKDLIEDTGDAVMFEAKNAALAIARKDAIAFVADMRAWADYKDNADTTAMYNYINDAYNALNDQYKKYPVSYGDIAELLAEVAEGVDAGVYGASTASIKAAAESIAFDMSTMDTFKTKNNSIFDEDRKFLFFNRVQSDGNDAEKALYTKYQALLAAVEEAVKEPEKPEVVKGDLTGDGVATPEDAIMIVKAFVGEITLTDAQKAAADFDGNGVVNADDALAVVKAYVGL